MAKLFASFGRTNEGKAWWLDQDGPGPYDNMEQRDNAERCLMGFSGAAPSIPSLYNNFKRIVQTDTHVMILIEMVHDARVVRMNSEHPGPEVEKWMGDSIGWWEGEALIVDTVHFSDLRNGNLFGIPSGAQKHVIERYELSEDKTRLLIDFVLEDPEYLAEPFEGNTYWDYSPRTEMLPFTCDPVNAQRYILE